MEAHRQLIRYAIAGSYALMIGAFFEVLFGSAWKESVDEIIPTAKADPITTIGGAVAVGFVLYQLYSAFDRPPVQLTFTIRFPRWLPARLRKIADGRTLCLRLFGAVDVSDEVLHGLHDLPMAGRALRRAFGCSPHVLTPEGQTRSAQERDVESLDEGTNLLNSVLNLTYSSGDGQIARSYAALEDIYHALGACDAALIAVSLAALLDIVAIHSDAFLEHLGPSLAVTGLMLMLILGSHRVIKVNRRRRRLAMTDQLRKDLRAWALRHPRLLSQLAEDAIGD
jgi:hypothetical protein